ncbi:MAG: hypothetical protein R3F65_25585 [bacterium]
MASYLFVPLYPIDDADLYPERQGGAVLVEGAGEAAGVAGGAEEAGELGFGESAVAVEVGERRGGSGSGKARSQG